LGNPQSNTRPAITVSGEPRRSGTAITLTPITGLDTDHHAYRRLEFIKINSGPYHPPLALRRNQRFVHEVIDDPERSPTDLILYAVRQFGDDIHSEQDLIEKAMELNGSGKKFSRAVLKSTFKEIIRAGVVIVGLTDGQKCYRLGKNPSKE
jgi:hypothetical protein